MIIQTWAFLAGISGQHPPAASDMIDFTKQFQGILCRACTCIRTEIFRFIPFFLSGKDKSGKILTHRRFNKRIALVILEHGVVFRTMLLDQIALQNQSLHLRVRNDILKMINLGYHFFYLG